MMVAMAHALRKALGRFRLGASPLTTDDLTDDGWEKKRRELEASGINPTRYLERELPKAMQKDPELRSMSRAFHTRLAKKDRLRKEFLSWAYRSALCGLFSVLVVGVLRNSPVWESNRSFVLAVGAVMASTTAVLTVYSLVLLFRYFRAPSD